jgi:clan AA aspartic protease (TIGR02281 family)
MNYENGIYTIPCKINGIPMKFIFDTGASDVSISLTEAQFLIKQGLLDNDDIKEKVKYKIANGEVEDGTKIILKEINIDGYLLKDVEASIVHQLNAPLLLGQSAISQLGTFQVDGDKLIININDKNEDGKTSNSISKIDLPKYRKKISHIVNETLQDNSSLYRRQFVRIVSDNLEFHSEVKISYEGSKKEAIAILEIDAYFNMVTYFQSTKMKEILLDCEFDNFIFRVQLTDKDFKKTIVEKKISRKKLENLKIPFTESEIIEIME